MSVVVSVSICMSVYIHLTPLPWSRCDTRSFFFKWSKAGLNFSSRRLVS